MTAGAVKYILLNGIFDCEVSGAKKQKEDRGIKLILDSDKVSIRL